MSEAQAATADAFCFACGNGIDARAEICPKCGVRQKQDNLSGQRKSRTTAALLAFFLGGVGVQQFYLGRTGKGVLSIIFFWTCIPTIIAWVHFIKFLCMSDEAFALKYG